VARDFCAADDCPPRRGESFVIERPTYRSLLACALALMIAGNLGAVVLAQQVPPSTSPGIQERRLEQPPSPRAEPPVIVPETPLQAPPPGAQDIVLTLTGVVLSGNTVFSDAELAPLWEPYLGREVTLAELWAIPAAITVHYRNAGYVLSRALIPPQQISGGTLQVQIIEGYVDNVIIEGEVTGTRWFVDHAIERIEQSRPLRADVLERYLLLLNDLPGVSAESILRPSPIEPGASELVVVWKESRVAGSAQVDNFGTRFLGPVEFSGTVVGNNLFGRYGITELRGVVTAQVEELQYVSLRQGIPITPEGTLLSVGGSYTWTEPQQLDGLQGMDPDGHSLFVSTLLTHPLIRTRSRNLSLFGGFRLQNSDNDLLGTTISQDRTRVLTGGGSVDFIDRFGGITLAGIDLAQGLDVLGARDEDDDPPPSRGEADPNFTRLAAAITRQQALGGGFALLGAVSGQYSFDPLPASEQYGIGGEVFGRGYGPYEIAGEQAFAGKLQLQYGAPWRTTTLAGVIDSWLAYTFADGGVVWHKSDPDNSSDSLTSAGIGLDLNLAYDVSGTLIVAQPISRDPTTLHNPDDRYPRAFFRLTKRF
jgi:hemolysin activation/secretion protein